MFKQAYCESHVLTAIPVEIHLSTRAIKNLGDSLKAINSWPAASPKAQRQRHDLER